MENGSELFGSTYQRGETVFRQGDPGDTMYIIQSGSVEVSESKNGTAFIVAIYGKGDFFGEMSLLQNDVRSTTAIAICDTLLTKLTKANFLQRLRQDPFMSFNLLKKLIQRVYISNLMVLYLNKIISMIWLVWIKFCISILTMKYFFPAKILLFQVHSYQLQGIKL